jgi:hypothetical protein
LGNPTFKYAKYHHKTSGVNIGKNIIIINRMMSNKSPLFLKRRCNENSIEKHFPLP